MVSEIEHAARGLVVSVAAAVGFDATVGIVAESLPGVNDQFLMQLAEKGGG
jgi:hypothetical protein